MNKIWIPINMNDPNEYDDILVYRRGGKIENRTWRGGGWNMADTHWMLAPTRPDGYNDLSPKTIATNKIDDLMKYILAERLAPDVYKSYIFLRNIKNILNFGNKLDYNAIEKMEEINKNYGSLK